jgi:hypothetical protein
MLFALGIACLAMAVVGLVWNLKVSYDSHCGGIGQIPVLGPPVIQLPLLTAMGISLLEKSTQAFLLVWWGYFFIWLAGIAVFTSLTIMAGRLGEHASKN